MVDAGVGTGAIVGALAGSVIPVVGTITGAILGGAYMYFRGKRNEQRLIQQLYSTPLSSTKAAKIEHKPRKTRSK